MRRGLFVYCRQTLRRRQHNDGGATTGSAGEAQQAPNGGADYDRGGDGSGGDGGGEGEKISEFDIVTARQVGVTNDAGEVVVALGTDEDGNGMVKTWSAKGKTMVELGATEGDKGMVATYQPNGKKLVKLSTNANGGFVDVLNKTGESIASMYADEYGNGVVWAGNRKGKGRTLQPGP